MPLRLRTPRRQVPVDPGQLTLPEPEPAPEPERGPCQCGTTVRTGWCGLNHHGIGCHENDTPLTRMPTRPGSTTHVAVCARCAARAAWWQTDPADRPRTVYSPPMGHVLFMPDGTRTPIGRKPRYAK